MFSAEDRLLFEYHNGAGMVRADPIALARRVLQAFEGDANAVIRKMDQRDNPVPIACAAADRFVAGVRQAFRLPEYDETTGEGTLEADVFRVWDDYQSWLEKKNPRPDPSLT